MKTAYLFDEKTGEFHSKIDVHESPEEPGEYLIPTYATNIAPPVTGVNEVAIYSAGAWTVVPYFRGQTVYEQTTGAELVIDAAGALPSGYAAIKPDAIVRAEEKAIKIEQIKADLATLDTRKIRPLAEGDTAHLAALNAQTATLRAELAAL